ncbi:MAG: thioesterase family protein [Actinomycetota bacterium]|nr:hypothetical protein [Actinomycetota bacterium]
MSEIVAGMHGEASRHVTEELTAERLGSGSVAVFGTPALLAMIEDAAVDAVSASVSDGMTTVGTWVELEHLAPSRVGARVRATATLTGIDGKRLEFECEAFEGDVLIGRARHRRALVNVERFLAGS